MSDPAPNRILIPRRDFLILSSCALTAAAFTPRVFASAPSTQRLAVGFVAAGDTAVVDASTIFASDGAFIGRGARVTVSGASGFGGDARQIRTAELLVRFSYLDGAEPKVAPFRAWASNRSTRSQGNSVAFNVPVDEVQRLTFDVVVESGDRVTGDRTSRRRAIGGSSVTTLPLTLSLQPEAGALLLAPGAYVIVPLTGDERTPDWRPWHLAPANGRMALVDIYGVVAPFEHFVVSVGFGE